MKQAEAGIEPAQIGRFRDLRLIAEGGMGRVYRALDGEAAVALKVLKPEAGEPARERLQREAKLAAGLDHPGIIRVLEVGQARDDQGVEQHYIAMELIEGPTLAQAVGELDRAARLRVFEQVVAAVAFAHGQGVVHRDLKPANVLMAARGPVVSDFGLARARHDAALTQRGAVLGTVHYMAPEQVLAEGQPPSAAADVWALGVILYELLTDALPFSGQTQAEVYRQILDVEPRPPRARRPDLPSPLEQIVLAALSKSPAERPPNAEALGAELARWREGRPLGCLPSRRRRVLRHVRGRRWPLIAAGLLGCVALLSLVSSPSASPAEDPEAHALAARSHASAGRWSEAEAAALRALELAPGAERAAQLAEIRRRRGEADGARQDARAELAQRSASLRRRIDHTTSLRYAREVNLRDELEPLEAELRAFEQVVDQRPRLAELPASWQLIGDGWQLCGARQRALRAYRRATTCAAAPASTWLSLARALIERELALARLPAPSGAPRRWRWQASAEQLGALRREAATALARADPAALQPLAAAEAAALRAVLQGDPVAARAQRERWFSDAARARQLGAEQLLAIEGYALQDPALRLARWRRAMHGDGRTLRSPWLHWLCASERARAGREAAARQHLRAALAVHPDCPLALTLQAVLRPSHEHPQALAELTRAAQSDTTLAAPLLAAAWLQRTRAPAQALEHARTATARAPRSWQAHAALAELLAANGQPAAAARARAIELAPEAERAGLRADD